MSSSCVEGKTKDCVKGLKRQATDQEKIFTNHICDKGLVFRIYIYIKKELSKFSSNINSLNRK